MGALLSTVRLLRVVQILCTFTLISTLSFATAEEVDDLKAVKYHKLLVKRPEPGYLFDRFYNTWLDESTVDALGTFLQEQADASNATPDQLLLAFFFVKKGDDVAALQLFNEALADNPASAATWYHKGLVEARTLNFETAIADLRKARERSPNEKLAVQIDKQLGKLLVRNRQSPEALKVWQELLQSRPNDDELAEDLMELYIDEGLLKEAGALVEDLLKKTVDPHAKVMRQLRLGDIRQRAGERDKAIEVYTESVDDVGSETWLEREILAQIDQVLRREDDLKALKQFYDDLVKKYAKRVGIHRRRAQLLLELGEKEEGLAAFREVLKLTPGHRPSREEYVTILSKAGSFDDAIKELKALCEQYPKDSELRFRLVSLLQEAKREADIPAATDEYLAASDGSEYAYLRSARALERLEDKQPAKQLFQRMAEKFVDSPSAQEAYAGYLYAQGEKKEALKLWQQLVKESDLTQVLHVARILSARNEHQATLETLKSREVEFAKDPLYLGQLVSTAIALKKFEEAIPWALERVKLASEVAELETAIDQAAASTERADRLEAIAKELDDRTDRSISETCLLAELWERIGDSQRADEVLKKVAEEGNVLAVAEQIRLASQRREWSAAADATKRMLDLPGGRKSLYVRRLVELYQRDFQLEEALKWVQEWKRLSVGSTSPWVTEARLLSGLGKPEEALKILRVASAQFEDDEDLRVRLAELYVESEKYADAERIYWQLYEDNEDIGDKLRWTQELAKLASQQGTTEQIVENFNQRIENNRRSIVPWLCLSEVYRVVNDYEGRRRSLTAAAKIKPDDIHLLQQIARVEEQDGDWQNAIKTLERAIPLDKTNRTREQIAQLNLRYGDEEVGFNQLLELASQNSDPRSLETAVDTLCGMQDWERAAEFLRSRIVEHPTDYRLRYLLGVALEEAGETNAALEQFLALLEHQEELKTKKGTMRSQSANQGYYNLMRSIMPPRAAEWIELLQYRGTAYAYRQQSSRVYALMSSQGGGLRSTIQMPANVESVRPMAIVHTLMIGSTLEDEKQQDLWRLLESQGVEHAAAMSMIDPQRGDFSAGLSEILEKHPKDETALAILIIQGAMNSQDSSSEHLGTAVEKFRKSYPQLAFMACVKAGIEKAMLMDGSEDEAAASNKFFDEALAIADDLETPNAVVVMAVTNTLSNRMTRGVDIPIDESYRKKFSQLMIKWYPQLTQSPYGQYAYFLVVQTLSANDDPTDYVNFLDDEVARFQSGGNRGSRNNSLQMMMMSRNRVQTLAPPTFPPMQLANFPASVLSAFSQAEGMNPFGQAMGPPGGVDEPAKKIKPLLDQVKSPILRILLAKHAELNDIVDAEIKQLLSAKSPNIDAFLLAACLAAEKENYVEVVRGLDKARYLPMSQEIRRRVDGSLVGAVLNMKEEERKAEPELLEAGKQASLRLRRAQLDPQARSELIAAMEQLGLQKEAKKLDQLASQSPVSAFRSAGQVYASPRATTPPDRIAKLISDGKRDVAVKLLAGELTGHVQQMLASMQNVRSYRYQFNDLKQRIESLGLTNDVLETLNKTDDKNSRRMLEYAMACQLFDLNDKAREQYERVLELRPKDDAARMQLIILVGRTNSAAANEQIKLLGKPALESMPQVLSEELQDYEASFEERLGYATVMVELLKASEPGDISPQSYGYESCLQSMGRNMHNRRGSSLPSLYVRKSDERRRSEVSEEILKKREQIHNDLCREMLKKPETARVGFKHLLASTEAKGESTDEFGDQAEKILLAAADASPRRGGIPRVVYYSSGSGEVRFRGPEEFLVDQAWKSGDWKLIDETLLPKLDSAKTRTEHDQLEALSTLYRCKETEFLEHAKVLLRRSQPASPMASNTMLTPVVETWKDRQLTADVQPMILAALKQDSKSQNHHQVPDYVVSYFEAIAGADRQKQLNLLDEIATIYIAPPEKRSEFVRKNYQQNRINWGTPNGRIYVFAQLLDQLLSRDELLFTVLEHVQQYEVPIVRNLEYRLRSALGEGQKAEGALKILKSSPWLEDLDEFRSFKMANVGELDPLAVLLQVHLNSDDSRQELQTLLVEQQKGNPTFGGGLVLAFLAQKSDTASLINYLGEWLPKIQKLPQEKQADLASMAADMLHASALSNKHLSAGALAAKEWLQQGQASQSQSVVARVEKAKRLEELGIEHGQIYEFARETLGPTIKADPASAVKILERVCQLARDAQRRGEWYNYLGTGESLRGWVIEQTSHYMNQGQPESGPPWNAYNFVVDVIKNPSNEPVEVERGGSNIVRNLVNAFFNRASRQEGKQKPADEQFQKLYEEVGNSIGDRPASLLMSGLYDRGRGMLDEKSCQKLREWAKTETEGGKYPSLAATIDITVALIASEKGSSANEKLKDGERRKLADYHHSFMELMDDADLPITWRLHLATLIARCQGEHLPLDVARKVIGTHAAAMEVGAPIPNDQGWQLTRVAISLLPEESAQEELKTWRENWASRFLKSARPVNQRMVENFDSLSHGDAICDGLIVFLAANDVEHAHRLLQRYSEQISSLPRVLATLVRAKQTEKAAEFVKKNWPVLQLDWPDEKVSYYNADIAAAAPAVYDAISSEDQRYLAELMIASMPDSKESDRDKSLPDRDARMSALAEKLDSLELKNESCRKRVLVLLNRNDATRDTVVERVAAEYKPENIVSVFCADNDGPQLAHETQLAVCHLGNQFREGNVEPYVKLLERLIAGSGEDDYQFVYRLVPILESFRSVLGKPTKPLGPKDCAEIAAQLRNIFKDREYMHLNDSRSFNNLLVAMQSQAGETDLANKWIGTVPENCRHHLENDGVNDDIWKFGLQINATATSENIPARLNYIEHVLRYTLARKWVRWDLQRAYYLVQTGDYELFDGIVKAGLMSGEELKEHGDSLVEKIGDLPMITAAWATWLQKQKEPNRAARHWQAVVDAKLDDVSEKSTSKGGKGAGERQKLSEQQADYVLNLSGALKDSDQPAQALEVLDLLGDKQVPGHMLKKAAKYRQELAPKDNRASEKSGNNTFDPPKNSGSNDAD